MQKTSNSPMSAAAGRKFGLTVGLAFVVIALLMLWRHHPTRAEIALTIGALLILAGIAIPTRLGPVERAWMQLAHLISKVTTPVFMGVVYFLIITPVGYLRRRTGSPIFRTRGASSWKAHSLSKREQMERQF